MNHKFNLISGKESISAEKSIWRAVISQAFIDLIKNSKRSEDVLAKYSAKKWFTENNTNFKTVCELAGVDPNWVLKQIKYVINNPLIYNGKHDVKKNIKKYNIFLNNVKHLT